MNEVSEEQIPEDTYKRCSGCPFVISVKEGRGLRAVCAPLLVTHLGFDANVAPILTGKTIPPTCDYLHYDPEGQVRER